MKIKGFVITEKTTEMVEEGKYSFWVDLEASKNQIVDAVEKRFSVEIVDIKTIVVKGKKKSWRQRSGKKKDRKKAIVKLKKGQKISEFEVAE